MTSSACAHDASYDNNGVLFVSFNQDYSSLSIGLNSGYALHNLNSIESLENIYDNNGETADVCIVERLFSSSLVAIVSMKAPRKLKVCHFKKGSEICNYGYCNQILAVRLNRQRLVVVLEDSLYVHNIKDMKVLHTIRDTPSNPTGICALSTNSETSYLAYPGSTLIGEVQIFDITNLKAVTSVAAHNGPLATLAFDVTGTKLATASVKGTVIRVFSIPDGQPLFELRRGLKRYVQISCLAFSTDSNFLCVSSNTETVHIFKLTESSERDLVAAEDRGSWMGYFNKVVSASVSYMPTQVSSLLTQDRDFATAKLPVAGTKSICAIITLQKVQCVIVACYNGYIYAYKMDGKLGGICELSRQHCILPGSQSEGRVFSRENNVASAESEPGHSNSDTEASPDNGDNFPHEEISSDVKIE